VRIVDYAAPLCYTGAIEYTTDNRDDVAGRKIALQEGMEGERHVTRGKRGSQELKAPWRVLLRKRWAALADHFAADACAFSRLARDAAEGQCD
jgi:hypothetical protein